MLMRLKHLFFFTYLLYIALAQTAFADTIRVAVASNFSYTMQKIAKDFESKTPHKVLIINGSTGKHTTQIMLGAPFDVFFAADLQHPQKLEQQGFAQANTRFTYAHGQLALWSHDTQKITHSATSLHDLGQLLSQPPNHQAIDRIALANPKLAPYGRAAQQVLTKIASTQEEATHKSLTKRLIKGENVSQAFQYVYSENAAIGFIALSQIKQLPPQERSSWLLIPAEYYQTIEQQAVIIRDSAVAQEFIGFVRSPSTQKLIQEAGYAQRR